MSGYPPFDTALAAMRLGNDPEGLIPKIQVESSFEKNILSWAIAHSNLRWVRACLDAGYSPNGVPELLHPLQLALSTGHRPIIMELLLCGATIKDRTAEDGDEFLRLLYAQKDHRFARFCIDICGGLPVVATPNAALYDWAVQVQVQDFPTDRHPFVCRMEEFAQLSVGCKRWFSSMSKGQQRRVLMFFWIASRGQPVSKLPILPTDLIYLVFSWLPISLSR